MDFRVSQTFSLLQQEGNLAKKMILSSFESLLNANMTDHQIGNFYSGFFQLSIGIERLLKLTAIINRMIENDYKPPTDNELKNEYGHKITLLFTACISIHNNHSTNKATPPKKDSCEERILIFLNNFAHKSRYYNLDALTRASEISDPIATWWEISRDVLEDDVPSNKREAQAMKLMHELDRQGKFGYSWTKDFDGHPMTIFDYHYRIYRLKQSAPYMIWKIISLFSPFYDTLQYLTEKAVTHELQNNLQKPVIPHMHEFFVFLLANRSDTLRRKKWTTLF